VSQGDKTKTVLIVDDDSSFGTLLKTALASEQITPVVAPKASDASVEVKGRKFDLIILDGELPDMNGMDWLAANRAVVGDTPVMFVSASWRDTDSHMKLMNELGVHSIVHKPVSLEVLVDETLRIVRSDAKPADPTEAGLAELAVNYVQEMTGEFKKISDMVRYSDRYQFARYDWKGAVMAAHKIHGTAGMFDFFEISRIAGVIEEELKEAAAKGEMTEAQRQTIMQQLGRVADELKHVKAVSEQKHSHLASEQKYHERISGDAARRVMIVDDDAFFLKRLEHLLAAENILLNSYSDSNRVVDAIDKFNPELVILDVNMPGLNGFEVCEEVRRKHPAMAVIIISADNSAEVQARATKSGANCFTAKPIKNMHFVSLIKAMLGVDANANAASRGNR
jgi:DNA-binding response OmpR family regulator